LLAASRVLATSNAPPPEEAAPAAEMDRYLRVERPRPESAIEENEIRITMQGIIRNYVSYAASLLQVPAFSPRPPPPPLCLLGLWMPSEIPFKSSVFVLIQKSPCL
jgi:hypothetical protein